MPRVPRLQEALLPAGLAAAGILELILLRPVGWPVGMAGELIALGALLWRRVYPIVAPTVALAAVITMYAVGPAMDEPSVPIAILMLISFSYARYVDGLQGMVGLVLMGIGVAALYVTVDTREHDWSDVAFVTALIVPPYVLGRLTRRLWQQGEQLRAQQELIKDQAVRDERERIARELHDVIAHSISAMVLQASAAQDLLRQDPDRARQALAAVTETGRTALAETSRLLRLIRDVADDPTPVPSLADLDDLLAGFASSGLKVQLDAEGDLAALPAAVQLSAYRIIQESLTNALRHGADSRASVRVTVQPTEVIIKTTNNMASGGPSQAGFGLLGMAERAALLGGSVRHQIVSGRFELTASLPIERSDSALAGWP